MKPILRYLLGFVVISQLLACNIAGYFPPDEARVKSDLIGQQFPFGVTVMGEPAFWRIEPEEIRGFRVTRRETDRKEGNDVLYIAIRLEGNINGSMSAINGDLKVTYRLYDQGWQLAHLEPMAAFSIMNR